nr:Chain R, Ribulose bisphosphate carboxylase large chain [Chlamydomonas reinhardtii]
WKEIKF